MAESIYVVGPTSKRLTPVHPVAFSDIDVRERQDLEAWIIEHPEALGEDLLVISPEFDKFENAARRLDILAMDREGSLVVVELKLDAARSLADQQAIRYAAFCSTMTMDEVSVALAGHAQITEEEAAERVRQFLGVDELPEINDRPRIILAAGAFADEELTSTVLWLRSFGVDITCVELTPFQLPDGGPIILVPKTIIPLPEAKQYLVRVEQKGAAKAQRSKEASAYAPLWLAIAEAFDAPGLGLRPAPPSRKDYMQIRTGTKEQIHYEWRVRSRERCLQVALHFEDTARDVNRSRLKMIAEEKERISAGAGYQFVAESWGKKWASAHFVIPYAEATKLTEIAPEAARLMRLLIERTWPIVEPFARGGDRAGHGAGLLSTSSL